MSQAERGLFERIKRRLKDDPWVVPPPSNVMASIRDDCKEFERRLAEAERERDQLIEKIIAHNERWAAEGGSVFSHRDQTFKNWDIKLTAPQQEQKS